MRRTSNRFHRTITLCGVVVIAVAAAAPLPCPAAAPVTLWRMGTVDGSAAEFALAPNEYAKFADDAFYVVGVSDPRRAWPYAQPGPMDPWAGGRTHEFAIAFALSKVGRGDCRLVVDLVDTQRIGPPTVRVALGGKTVDVGLPPGGSDYSIAGQFDNGRRHRFAASFPSSALHEGVNLLTITTTAGCWMIYDALAFEAPAGTQLRQVEGMQIAAVRPTPLYPKPAAGESLRQEAQAWIVNAGPAAAARLRMRVDGRDAGTTDLGRIPTGGAVRRILVPELAKPAELTLDLLVGDGAAPAAQWRGSWQPQKKWRLFCVAYSHHDLGFGDYPHRLRENIRHANIERPLEFCTKTDGWDEDSRFRFVIETSEPVTSFLGSRPPALVAEFARRVGEGRIQIAALHNTANTEQLSHELLARLFYLTNRHTRDLLGTPKSRTAQIDDVIGLTWPLATLAAEAEVPYFFHGPNGVGQCFGKASDEPVFYWQGPDGQSRVLTRSAAYGGYAGDNPGDCSAGHLIRCIERLSPGWPYDALLLQEGTDFQLVTMDTAQRIRQWNARYAYPRLVCATMDMFFDAIAKQANPATIKTFAGDGNNQWADQDANDAWLLGQARRLDEAIPTAEKFATIAQAVAGGGNSWTDLYQAYHRLLAYHEHTNAIDFVAADRERIRRYETELAENREMVAEAQQFTARAQSAALGRLAGAIARKADRSLVVFNPLARARTDVVRVDGAALGDGDRLIDAATGRETPWQRLADRACVFIGHELPPLGYRTYSIEAAPAAAAPPSRSPSVGAGNILENRFYRIVFDPQTGAIASLRDKIRGVELVDQSAPHRFNEYLYERFESTDWKKPTVWRRVEKANLLAASGPVADVMHISAQPAGVDRLQQTVLLYRDSPRIDFVLELVKSPSGRRDYYTGLDPCGKESVYLAMPFGVPGAQVRHELPGCVSEPVRDLFDGACTAFYAVRHFTDISNARGGATVSAIDSSLVEYDRPRSCPIRAGEENSFEKQKRPIATGRMYLYLMNNMFDVNVRWDQPGPVRFAYSMQSHAGDWRGGAADRFGWDTMNPPIALAVTGRSAGPLPCSGSFAAVEADNVACTTIKPAEANGAGFILRFVETQGRATTTSVSLPFLGPLASATATSLVEDDRPAPLAIEPDGRVRFSIGPFGVRTIRVRCRPRVTAAPAGLAARALSDMEVSLTWQTPPGDARDVSHFHVYRSAAAACPAGLLNLVERPAGRACVDRPKLHYGGWINNRLEPGTTYYYRVAAVDRWNNEGPASPPIAVATPKTAKDNMRPLPVECLRAIPVSPISATNAVNLMWRTSCESDVHVYEVHRSTTARFTPSDATRIATIDARAVLAGGAGYGQTPIEHRLGDYDHQMHFDTTVQPATRYYYRVCAVDDAGQRGEFCPEVATVTGGPDSSRLAQLTRGIETQSVYSSDYRPEFAVDGIPDSHRAWIAKPYGGGTKQQSRDVWWSIRLPQGKSVALRGVRIVGDHRDGIPAPRRMLVQVPQGDGWKTVGDVTPAAAHDILVSWPAPIDATGLRIVVPADALPQSPHPELDGIVRIAELLLVLPGGREATVLDSLAP